MTYRRSLVALLLVGLMTVVAGSSRTLAQTPTALAGSPTAVPGTGLLIGITCPSSSFCYTVGESAGTTPLGVVVPVTNGNPGSPVTVAGTGVLVGIACPSSSTCLAVGSTSASVPAANAVGVVVPLQVNGASLSAGSVATVNGTQNLSNVACPTSNLCEAVGANSSSQGVVVQLTNGSPGGPTVVAGTAALSSIVCPNSSTCFASGNNGSAGIVLSLTVSSNAISPGNATTVAGTGALGGIACPNPSQGNACYTVGESAGSSPLGVFVPLANGNPGGASTVSGAGTLVLIATACSSSPQVSTCLAAGLNFPTPSLFSGVVVPITNGNPGSPFPVAGTAELDGIACASPPQGATCYAVGQNLGSSPTGVVVPVGPSVPQPAPGNTVGYSAGWNLVGGPSDTVLTGAIGALFTYQAADATYESLPPSTPLQGTLGYWAYFPSASTVALPAVTAQSLTILLPANHYIMVGNPADRPVTLSGADVVFTYNAAQGQYSAVTTLQPGQGAWVFSRSGGTLTIMPQ